MITDKALEELLRDAASKNGGRKNFLSGAFVDVNSKPVISLEDMPFSNPDIHLVRSFEMNLKYMPRDYRKDNACDYTLTSFMLSHGAIYLESWEDFLEKSKEDSESGKVLNWIKENTNICKRIFDIAKTNKEYRVPIAFDVIKYGEKIVGDKCDTFPFLTTPFVAEVENLYIQIRNEAKKAEDRERALARYYAKKEAKKCQH